MDNDEVSRLLVDAYKKENRINWGSSFWNKNKEGPKAPTICNTSHNHFKQWNKTSSSMITSQLSTGISRTKDIVKVEQNQSIQLEF